MRISTEDLKVVRHLAWALLVVWVFLFLFGAPAVAFLGSLLFALLGG